MQLADINGDGDKDLITGKRFYAHNGHDPGGKDPVVMYWYEVQRKKTRRRSLFRTKSKRAATPESAPSSPSRTFDGDGTLDIILGNKKGVNVLLQKRDK